MSKHMMPKDPDEFQNTLIRHMMLKNMLCPAWTITNFASDFYKLMRTDPTMSSRGVREFHIDDRFGESCLFWVVVNELDNTYWAFNYNSTSRKFTRNMELNRKIVNERK